MKVRQFIIIGVGLLILLVGKLISDKLAEPKEKTARIPESKVTIVFTEDVKNSTIPIMIESTGLLEAVNRMELFSEVQGIMLPDNGRFKPGNSYARGQLLINIRAEDQRAAVIAKRSSFQRSLSAVLPDIKLDFTDEFPAWQAYLQALNVESTITNLPEVKSDKLKLFLTGRNIFSEYYSVKNAEILLSKYNILAPYNGVLIQADVDPGTVIRPGQRLGVFIQPGEYELEVSVNASSVRSLSKGQEVELTLEGSDNKKWIGKISRVNSSIDPESQMSQVFIRVSSSELKDGMYLKARIKGKSIPLAFEIPRAVLLSDSKVYVVKDNTLTVQKVEPLHFNERTVIVRGLEDGANVITKIPPAAYDGMSVNIFTESQDK